MKIGGPCALCAVWMALVPAFGAETNHVDQASPPGADATLIALRAENEALRRENQRLRRELVRRRRDEPKLTIHKPQRAAEAPEKVVDDGGYWLTAGSNRRHNSKCRYYKMGNGRPCGKDEGEACRKCGG